MGAYHTGTVVYDREFGFGGHPFASSGIFQTTPMDIDSLGEEISFKERLYMGRTYLSKKAVERLLASLADEFRGDAYHLLHFNCNHFTSQFVDLLCHGVLPKWINRLARIVSGLPFIETFLPPHWIRPSLMYDCEFDDLSNDDEEEERTKDINQNDQNAHLINGNTNDNNNNQIVCYKNEDEDLSITKSFTEKPYFQFVHSTSTNNGHVPHRITNSIENNNKTSVDHSDNHHPDSSLFQLRTV
ncbi:unnamed protein product [Schistosoma rodhaini]|uniref:PPPDE domain-containing protein n=1 Tax=Schistosoma rodhaini TaxID=6188 RepID=A0AA85FIY0_9TREM|nr:unnamed protein product [Schistosoma rodhaini]